MKYKITGIENENVAVLITYEAGETLTGSETINIAGLPITQDIPTDVTLPAEEKTELRTQMRADFRALVTKEVANHIRTRLDAIPKAPSATISAVVNWERTVTVTLESFVTNYAEE